MNKQKSFMDVISSSIVSPSASLSEMWAGKSISLTDGGFWSQFLGYQSSSGKTVGVNNAMKLSTVWACVRLISTSVAGLPFGVYKKMPDGGRQSAKDLNVHDIIHTSPNEDMTAFQFWQAVVSSMLLWGNAYCEIY
ncbi:phage portal protein, partial [Vibrio anguillarum]